MGRMLTLLTDAEWKGPACEYLQLVWAAHARLHLWALLAAAGDKSCVDHFQKTESGV